MNHVIYSIEDEYGVISENNNFRVVLKHWIEREIRNILQTYIEDDETTAKEVVNFLKNYRISKKVSPYLQFKAISKVISEYENVEEAYGVKFNISTLMKG
ncbi:hypothetical protein BUY22_02035 [Staphylococcus cohnii]|nr:hypothetical protein BUY22_02035 [Staphylococcus cohnii]